MSNLSAAQQGYDFEQIASRKIATALKDGTLSIPDGAGNTVSIVRAPHEKTATTLKAAENFTLEDFLNVRQTQSIFLPANKDGPDVVF